MKEYSDNMPDPKEIERKLGEFLSREFGGEVKVMSPVTLPREISQEQVKSGKPGKKRIHFDLKPRELIAWLDQYIVRQDHAKAVLSTKICTHFNRIMHEKAHVDNDSLQLTGRIKNNVLMMGPTGVGKTYMIKLIAKKIGVPFVKGDATKFSETGYVGGDVEDLVRDLVREADDDLELAQYGIIYIDEIDKIASSRNLIGADVSRTGVQRALLKPMEETEVDMKVPHDPISMIQEIERFRKTGKRTGNTVNTRNILFIMSGAFSGLDAIISKRLTSRKIGFGAQIRKNRDQAEILGQVRSEDLVEFGFESEFVGRLPVHAVLERLSENDLLDILKNPNNPVILGKKLDFAAYNIRIKFADDALRLLARRAYRENTGARGLVSAIERALLPFETELPSLESPVLPVTEDMIREPEKYLKQFRAMPDAPEIHEAFDLLCRGEKEYIMAYADENRHTLMQRHSLGLTPSRIDILADYYVSHIMDIDSVIRKIKACSDEIKKAELFFYKTHDINIVMEEDAIDYMIGRLIHGEVRLEEFHKKLSLDFEYGLKLVRDRIGKNRFFITRDALIQPEAYIASLLKTDTELADKGIGKK